VVKYFKRHLAALLELSKMQSGFAPPYVLNPALSVLKPVKLVGKLDWNLHIIPLRLSLLMRQPLQVPKVETTPFSHSNRTRRPNPIKHSKSQHPLFNPIKLKTASPQLKTLPRHTRPRKFG